MPLLPPLVLYSVCPNLSLSISSIPSLLSTFSHQHIFFLIFPEFSLYALFCLINYQSFSFYLIHPSHFSPQPFLLHVRFLFSFSSKSIFSFSSFFSSLTSYSFSSFLSYFPLHHFFFSFSSLFLSIPALRSSL